MKIYSIALVAVIACSSCRTSAQPMDEMMPRHRPPPDRSNFDGEKPGPASPIQQWMRELEESNPPEFNRLHRLRMKNPEAFRAEARTFLQKQYLERMAIERPHVFDIISNLPEDDRTWLIEHMLKPPGATRAGPSKQHEFMADKKTAAWDHNRPLIRQYRMSRSVEEKEQIREQLRINLSVQYDQRLTMRKDQLQAAEQKLSDLREAVEQGEQDKERFIEEKISIWLDEKQPNEP